MIRRITASWKKESYSSHSNRNSAILHVYILRHKFNNIYFNAKYQQCARGQIAAAEGSITSGSPHFLLLESHQWWHGEEHMEPLPPAPAFWHRGSAGRHGHPRLGTHGRSLTGTDVAGPTGEPCDSTSGGAPTNAPGHGEVFSSSERRARSSRQISGAFQAAGGIARRGRDSLLHLMKWLKPTSLQLVLPAVCRTPAAKHAPCLPC